MCSLVTIRIEKEIKDKLMREVKSEFLAHNKKFEGMKLTQHFLLRKVVEFYLKY